MSEEERKTLIAQGWTPPLVDPDIAEAETLWGIWLNAYKTPFELACAGIKRGRELERLDIQRAEGRAFMRKFFPHHFKGPNP